jgi:hypothetical protein
MGLKIRSGKILLLSGLAKLQKRYEEDFAKPTSKEVTPFF